MEYGDHPAKRPTRYHWAAGLNPLHWGPALAGWASTLVLGGVSLAGQEWAGPISMLTGTAALGWSALWLLLVPATPAFKRVTDSKLLAQFENDYGYQLVDLSARIHPDLRDKVDMITAVRDKAREILAGKFGERDPFAQDNLEKLDRLAINYLQLLVALSEYDEYTSLVDPVNIRRELEAAIQEVDAADETIKAARQRTVELLQNRLQRYEKALRRIELIKAQCKNVEATMKLLVDQAMTAHDPKRVGKDIDVVLNNIQESEILSAELSAYDDLEAQLDSTRFRSAE
jgi:hypothetical protein